MAEAKAQEQGAGAFTESEGSLSNTINASKDNDGTKLQGFDDGKSQWTNPAPLPALPEQVSTMEHTELLLHLPAARPLTSVSPNSPCSRFYTRSEESIGYCRPCGVNRDSRVLSIFSDLSDCDVLPLELAHVPQTQDVQLYNLHLSMLFDGQYGDNADLGTGLRLTTAGADIQSCSDTSSSGDNAYDDDVALADIAAVSGAIISPAPLQPRPSPVYLDATASAADCGSPRSTVLASSGSADGHGSSFSARTRKLTAALVRGAPLEGLRSLHRKIKPANQRASGDSVSSSNSDKESATKQQFNSDLRQRKAFRFNELVAVYETWDCDEYDRKGVPSVRLDASLIEEIKQELNEFKVYEMLVHNESRSNTHFIY
ncbi:hypothetical protein GGI20_004865 [Coemansia sp. BCRC 34301]|nr:hypothetical protein GGI20_004865 [Coemansia sp. BCRC 34301]